MKGKKPNCRILQFWVLTVLFFSSICLISAQSAVKTKPNLHFYGSVSYAGDEATIELTEDLFFSQLSALGLFAIQDKREIVFSSDVLAAHSGSEDMLFYAEIYQENGEWICVLHLINATTKKEAITKNNYDGYYKILIGAKDSLSTLIQRFDSDESTPLNNNSTSELAYTPDSTSSEPVTAENLSGTWKGESHIDKIVILRGGRGFVFFENGASMNISVSVSGSNMTARQESKSNASFLPHLPREVALVSALNADPIIWELSIENKNSLSGIKHTPLAEYDATGNVSVIQGTVPVQWYR